MHTGWGVGGGSALAATLAAAVLSVAASGCAGNRGAVRNEPADPASAGEGLKSPATPPDGEAQPGVGGSAASEEAGQAPESAEIDPKTAAKDHGRTFVDRENGFTIGRPGEGWRFRPGEALNTDNIVVPLVVSDESSGAQVVVQVAPAVASPAQFAERLTSGLQSREGFSTSEVQPIPLAEGAVGFDFLVGDQVHGRVAIVEGSAGRVYVLLATWPRGSPEGVETEVDFILGSMKTSE